MERVNIRVPYTGDVGPTACPGQDAGLPEGQRHLVFRETVVPGQELGGLTGTHDNAQGAHRVDPTSGDTYRVVFTNNETLNFTPGGALVFNNTDNRVEPGQGSVPDRFHGNSHTTITPNGMIVGEHINVQTNCPPPPPPDGGGGDGYSGP